MTLSLPFDSAELRTLEAGLAALGFIRHPQPVLADTDRKVLWQRAIEDVTPVCGYNGGLHLNLMLFESKLAAPRMTHVAVEAELQAQLPDTHWTRLTLTALEPSRVLAQVDAMQAKLVAAWLAVARLSTAQTEGAGPFVIRYADGAYNFGPDERNGFPTSLAEATRYATRAEAQAKATDLDDDVEIIDLSTGIPGDEPTTLLTDTERHSGRSE